MHIHKGARAVAPLLIGVGTVVSSFAVGSAGASTQSHTMPVVTASSFTRNFSAMTRLKPVTRAGHGIVAVILPDTVSSARYTEFDAPYLIDSLKAGGLSTSQYTVENAQGSDSTELTDAQSAITKGATVLVVDPLDAGVGKSIEQYAKNHGVKVIDYDRLVLGGQRSYYVSFNNVRVGTLIGTGFVACAASWHVAKPNVLVMSGAATDNNATLFAQGYNGVLASHFSSGAYVKVGAPAGTWDPPTAETTFQQQLTAHPAMNSAVVPNDENAAPIISYLKSTLHIKKQTFPITGQDATLNGLDNILSGYQCGTVYKPIYLEAQAAAALAIYLRAGDTPPAGLVNGSTKDTTENKAVASVLLTPQWVTSANMKSTVVADHFVTASQLCAAAYKTACTGAGISS